MEKFGAYRCRKCGQLNRLVMQIQYVPQQHGDPMVEEHIHVVCHCGYAWDQACDDVDEKENGE